MMKKLAIVSLMVVSLLIGTSLAGAQEKFPSKPIEVVVPFAAGGSTDVLGRLVAKYAPKYFDKPLVIVNKPGGGGVTGTKGVVRSKPDGYTLFLGYGSGHDLVEPHFKKLPYDTFGDLLPVCRLSIHSVCMIIRPDAPYKTLKEFVEWGKNQKRTITGSVSTKGASVDITMQALMKVAGVKAETIPFRGGAEAVTAVLGGHTDFGGAVPQEVMTHVKAGRLRMLGVCLRERDPAIPDVPTFMEQGINTWTIGAIRGIGAPKNTPDSIISYLETTFRKLTEDPEFHTVMRDIIHPVMYRDRKAFLKNMQDGFETYGKLIEALNLKPEKK